MCLIKLRKQSKIIAKPPKQLKDLCIFDTIWVEDDGIKYTGWIYDISRRHVTVVYGEGLNDYQFRLVKPLTETKIVQGNKILYCNE